MLENKIKDIKEVRGIQGEKGNYDYDDYMLGLYNGIELSLAILEDREPIYREPIYKNKEER